MAPAVYTLHDARVRLTSIAGWEWLLDPARPRYEGAYACEHDFVLGRPGWRNERLTLSFVGEAHPIFRPGVSERIRDELMARAAIARGLIAAATPELRALIGERRHLDTFGYYAWARKARLGIEERPEGYHYVRRTIASDVDRVFVFDQDEDAPVEPFPSRLLALVGELHRGLAEILPASGELL